MAALADPARRAFAPMLELADRYASGAYAARRGGSTPPRGTERAGEGQDSVEVMQAAKRLHVAMSSTSGVDPNLLRYYGDEVARLSKPKPKK